MQWLRQKKVKTVKDIKEKCEWKWQHDEQEKELCVKRWDNEYDVCEKVESNEMANECKHSLKNQHLSENCAVTLCFFLRASYE